MALKTKGINEKMKQELESKLEEADIPECRDILWLIFWDIFSGELVTYSDIQSYLYLTQLTLNPYEVELLRSMDNAGCSAVNDIRYPDKK